MSRASKYLRKKLAEGGMLDPKELKKLVNDNPPKPGTGVAGPQSMKQAMVNYQANNLQAKTSKPKMSTQAGTQPAAPAPQFDASVPLPTQLQQQQKLSYRNNAAQNTPEKIRERMGAAFEQNQPTPSAQRPDDGMPSWMTSEQKAAMKQVNAENQATMESPEYQEALQKFQDSKGQDSEAQALLEKLSGEMAAKQNTAVQQPRFNLMGFQAQQQQGNAPQRRAASAQSSAPSIGDYDNADDYYNDYVQNYINTTGDYALDNLPTDVKQQWNDSQTADAVEPQSGDEGRMGGGVNYGGPGFETTDTDTDTQDTDTGGVTSSGSVTVPETRTVESIPKVEDPGSKPVWNGPDSGAGYEAHLTKLNNWNAANAKYQSYLNEVAEVEANIENDKNNSGTDNMAKRDDNALPDTRGGEPADLTGSGGTKTTGVEVGGSGGSGGGAKRAPVDIQVTGPTYSTPTVDVASVSEDQKVYRSDFPEGEEGNEKYQVARAKEAQKLVAQGAEQPRRSQFPEGEAGDTQYKAATQRFRETALVAEGTVTEDRNVAKLGSSTEIERTEEDVVTADTITAAQVETEPKREDFETPEAFDAAMADYKSKTEVSKPTDVSASSMEAATVGVPPPKPKRKDFIGKGGGPAFEEALAQHEIELKEFYKTSAMRPVDTAIGSIEEDSKAIATQVDGTLSEGSKATAAARDTIAEDAAKAGNVEYSSSEGAYVNQVTGEVATVEETKEAEAKEREAIIGEPATGEAAEIMSMYDYNQSQKRVIQGADAKKKAVKKLKALGLKDVEIAERLADNPDLIADEMEDLPEDVRTTLSGLPKEALIDVQMESLMSGMEDGEVPAWARPALAKVEANLARRGMSASSVGRDALFNAVIQSAIPMAQANASAIQSATAQDKQIAADFLAKNAGFQQQMNLANLSNDQQMRLANLTAQNQAASENLSNAQQTELANLNTRMQTNLLQGKIAAEMGVAQLNVDQQRAVVNAQTSAGIDMAKFNAAQQVELTNSKFMQNMVSSKFSADQQAALQTASSMASMDMANLDKNTKLAVTNAQSFLQMDMANLSNRQQSAVLTAQQNQQVLLSNQSAQNAAAQFNAANQQQADQFMANLGVQIEQYNVSANTAREQFNATEQNRIAAQNAGNKLQADQFEAQLETDIAKFNEQQDFQRDQWNAANAQAVEQSNTQWRRQANLADTAAQNAANQQNAQMSYNLTSQELTQVWQQLRDSAAYARQSFENEEQRKAQLLATALGNEKVLGGKSAEAASDWLTKVIK